MDPSTDWGSALAILTAGLVLGLLVFLIARKRKVSAASHRLGLETRRDRLLQQLRDLGDDVPVEERAWLESEAAGVLRSLDRLPKAPKSAAPAPPAPSHGRSGFVWGVLIAVVLGGIVYSVTTFTNERGTPMEAAQMQPQPAEAVVTDTGGMPPDHPPFPGMEAAAQEPNTSARPIQITLMLDPSSTLKSGVVYVIARGAEAGHPVAVRRIDAPGFPLSLELSANDAMMGQPLPQHMRIEARLDADGDAGTTGATDARAAVDGVTEGASVELTLGKG